jgi:translation initiation factor IF-2
MGVCMRVYELAKKNGISSKEALGILQKASISVSSHMSVIGQEDQARAETLLGKKIDSKKETSSPSKKIIQGKKTIPKVISKEKSPSGKKIFSKKIVASSRKKMFHSRYEKEKQNSAPAVVTEIEIKGEMPLFKVANLIGRPSGELVLALLKKGMMCNCNHILSVATITSLAHHFGIEVIVPEKKSKSVEKIIATKNFITRWPIVVVMGHVDHGKTTLLDFVRKMNTAAREKGGITQHLGAYEVDSVHGKIVFLDTPGHEAFSYMRERGARVTDLAVLVIAADDGIKPQTIEAIKHAREADVPILVAINKIDKLQSTAGIETVKRQLAQHDLLPEDWGGDIICVPISAKTGEGVGELLEMIVLQSQMLELKADPNVAAKAFVLESKVETGHGPVATVICRNGTIEVGDYFICGSSTGKVRLLINSFGERVAKAGPAIPVQVVGFDNFVSLGDWLNVVSVEEYSKAKSNKRSGSAGSLISGFSEGADVGSEEKVVVPLLVKTDTQGSQEAVWGEIKKINKTLSKIGSFKIVQSVIGDISEGDVEFAENVGALIVGLHVKTERNALSLSKSMRIDIYSYQIIYKMAEDLEELLRSKEKEIIITKKVGEAVVRKTFALKGNKVIAGCYVNDGVISRNNKVLCLRDEQECGTGKITSLQRNKKVVKEVHAGHECGFICENFNDWQEGDIVHCFIEEKKKQSEI